MRQLAPRDARSLFERAWAYGLRAGLLSEQRREELLLEGTRAIRKIADILGTEHLRGDLERALRSMLGLLNIHLERVSGGDVEQAARSLAEHGLLFHTRGASRAIKRVLAAADRRDPDALDPHEQQRYEEIVVTEWPGRSLADLLAHEEESRQARAMREAAHALVHTLGGSPGLDDAEPQALIMTGLLVLAYQPTCSWIRDLRSFEGLLAAVRRSPGRLDRLPQGIPPVHREAIAAVWAASAGIVRASVVDSALPLHVLAAGGPDENPLYGHLAPPDDGFEFVASHDVATTAHWEKLTRGSSAEPQLLLVLLQHVAGVTDKPPFSLKTIARLLQTQLRERPADRLLSDWLAANVPHHRQPDLTALWADFWEEREALAATDPAHEDFKPFARTWFPMRAPSGSRSPQR